MLLLLLCLCARDEEIRPLFSLSLSSKKKKKKRALMDECDVFFFVVNSFFFSNFGFVAFDSIIDRVLERKSNRRRRQKEDLKKEISSVRRQFSTFFERERSFPFKTRRRSTHEYNILCKKAVRRGAKLVLF